ncbi:MAG: hypothetical protein J5J06_00660 [Phycisphaerae bacterium]|nr:hypothetical protein [Phycisphaerae bacterium]
MNDPHRHIDDAFRERVRALTPAKALAIAAYGESVAAYRYRTLIERTQSQAHRDLFARLADEEQGHHGIVQKMLKAHFADSDFLLSPEDKDLVIVGPRLLEVSDVASVGRAMEMICASERLTGRFYAALHETTAREELKPFLHEMAEECFDHARQLEELDFSAS